MVERRERLLKLTQDKKNNKRIVKPNQPIRLGPTLEQVKDGSNALSGSRDVVQRPLVLRKHMGRPESEPVDLTEDDPGAQAFNLPPCFVEKDFFEGFPLAVSNDESAIITRM